jgi:hypothetical protein
MMLTRGERVLLFERIGWENETLMKALNVLICCLVIVGGAAAAQQPLSRDEALEQLYRGYDSAKLTAQWVCASGQNDTTRSEVCQRWKEYDTVFITELLMAEVWEGGVAKVYVVASAAPDNSSGGFDCHECAPAIGVAVFVWKVDRWALQSANAGVGFAGGWGQAPDVDLVTVGPSRHGLLLSSGDEGQGFSSSYKALLVPVDKTVSRVWSIEDEQDDFGAYDPTDKFAVHVRYRSSSAFKFVPSDENANGENVYYDIEVVSRGRDQQDQDHPMKQENWTEVYRFSGGKYKLLRHTDFVEMKKAAKK